MSRMNHEAAESLADQFKFDLSRDFHALDADQVEGVIAAADQWRYRAPKHANGSRARYFHAYLQRAARRPDAED